MKAQNILFLIIFSFVLISTTAGQEKPAPFAVGSWLGEVEWGGTKFRLVFHIVAQNDGTLTGTLDSPDKGIKGIPLSRVLFNKERVLFEISVAQASYDGLILNDKTTIEGVWTEGATVLPLILHLTTESIEPRNLAKKVMANGLPLDLQKASLHFDFYSLAGDQGILNDIAKALEDEYRRITLNLNTGFSEKIRVYIYPDLNSFHLGIFLPDGPDWVVAAAGVNELKMVSPMNPGSAHNYKSLMQAIIHELVHTTVLKARGDQGLVGLPKWLNEGYAFYEARQMTQHMRQMAKSKYAKQDLPRWSDLDRASVEEFGAMDGYVLSATIIEFLVKVHGRDKLIKFINNPENIKKIYGETEEELEKSWGEYLRDRE